MVEKNLSEVKYEDRKEALKQKTGTHKKLLSFFKQFQPSLPNLKSILKDKWHLIQNQPLLVTISRIPDRQAKISRIPCPNFDKSRFPESSQIPIPVKIFCVFPNPAPYFGQIPDPENTLPDPFLLLKRPTRIRRQIETN